MSPAPQRCGYPEPPSVQGLAAGTKFGSRKRVAGVLLGRQVLQRRFGPITQIDGAMGCSRQESVNAARQQAGSRRSQALPRLVRRQAISRPSEGVTPTSAQPVRRAGNRGVALAGVRVPAEMATTETGPGRVPKDNRPKYNIVL